MKTDSGNTESIWTATADVPLYGPLDTSLHTNVCIVGAGIAGLSVAYLLAAEGKSVVVVDDGLIAGGETSRTSAHLSNALDDHYSWIEKKHGAKGAKYAAESHTAAIDEIERIVNEEKIDCDFMRVDGYLFNPAGSDQISLEDELEACHRAGLVDVEMVDRIPGTAGNTGPALRFKNQAQFHPIKYVAGLVKAIEKNGGKIFCRTHVEEVKGGETPSATIRDGHKITANAVVVATNTPVNDWVAIHTKQEAYRTYMIGGLIPKGSVKPILMWDTPDPYHYARIQQFSDKHDVLLVGGEDHRTGQDKDTDSHFDQLEDWARFFFPMIEFVEYRWSGQVVEPLDGMAFIGPDPGGEDNVYVVTGDSGHGLTHGTIAGILLSDMLDGRDNNWKHLYDPKRKMFKELGAYTAGQINVATQYIDFLTPGDVSDETQIENGEGAIVRKGLQKIAAYRDDNGNIHEMSAVCPHLGCVVEWNKTEKSWDCPCHGSRFDAYGKVINGPANTDLSVADDDEPEEVTPVQVTQ